MAKVVIDMPDYMLNQIMTGYPFKLPSQFVTETYKIIRNGKILPKGHGRLIDADKFLKDNEAYTGWILNSSDWGGENAYKDALEDLVNEAPTIIEADKAESEGEE